MSTRASAIACAVAVCLSPLVAHGRGPQVATFSAKVEMVRVDALVTENGQPVRGLGRADFDVRDNGVPQQVELASFEQMPLNVIVALDVSESVAGEPLEHLRTASLALLDALEPRDRAGLLAFSDLILLSSPLTSERERVRAAVKRLTAYGATALFDATYAGIVLGESDQGRSLLIVFTDGADTASFLTRDAVLDTAKRSDVVIYGVAAGLPNRARFLKQVTAQAGGSLFEIESTKDVGKTFLTILSEFRNRYLLSYVPRNVTRDGWHHLEVRVKNRRGNVKARPGYQVGR